MIVSEKVGEVKSGHDWSREGGAICEKAELFGRGERSGEGEIGR